MQEMDLEKVNLTSKVLAPYEFKVPLKRLSKPKKVLSEDEFSQSISKIIERDFFPDLPKLEAQAEYYEALEKNDLVKLREIQMRFKRPDTGCSDVSNTPSTFETPAEVRRRTTPAKRKQINRSEDGGNSEQDDIQEAMENLEEESSEPRIKLDAFLAKNTSEDSASFAEILKESERKHRLKHAWIFEKEKEQLAEHEDMIALPPIEEQAAIKDRPAHINSWKYTNENAVMYVPEGLDLSAKEKIEEQKHKPKQIIHENTRFQHNPFNNARSKEAMQKAACFKALTNLGKIGHDGKEIQPSQSPQVNGYGFVATPSPAPGVNESPLMTWGEIDSTPSRLDSNNETIPGMTPGPVFRFCEHPIYDIIAQMLGTKPTPSAKKRWNSTPPRRTLSGQTMDENENILRQIPLKITKEQRMRRLRPLPKQNGQEQHIPVTVQIPAVPKRDRLALELSEKASKAHRAKKEEAIRQVTRRFASPSPSAKIGLSSAERLNSMSPAAQRLASKRLGIKTSTDKALLASYTPSPSPSHRLPGTKTPVRLTPGSRRSHGSLPGSPAVSTPASERGNATPENSSDIPSLTDHLLNLPKRKRKSAADFF